MSDQWSVNVFLCLQVAPSEVSRVPTPLPTPKLTPAVSRTHSPSRAASRPAPALPTAGLEPQTPPAGSGPPPANSGPPVAGSRPPVASGVEPSVVAPVKPMVEPAAAPVAASLPEPAAAVSRQLEQAAAMVLANTQTMLTHAAAALVSGQMTAPASVQPTATAGPSDLEKAVALVLSTAKEAGARAGTREVRQEEGSEEEEEEERGVRVTEEDMWRTHGLITTLSKWMGLPECVCVRVRVRVRVRACVSVMYL